MVGAARYGVLARSNTRGEKMEDEDRSPSSISRVRSSTQQRRAGVSLPSATHHLPAPHHGDRALLPRCEAPPAPTASPARSRRPRRHGNVARSHSPDNGVRSPARPSAERTRPRAPSMRRSRSPGHRASSSPHAASTSSTGSGYDACRPKVAARQTSGSAGNGTHRSSSGSAVHGFDPPVPDMSLTRCVRLSRNAASSRPFHLRLPM